MLDSLYGDLPPSKEDSSSSSNRSVAPKSTSLLGSLYDDLDDGPGEGSPTGSPSASSSSSCTSGSSTAVSSSAVSGSSSGASAWAAHRLQLLTPAVVRKQTLAAAAARTTTTLTGGGTSPPPGASSSTAAATAPQQAASVGAASGDAVAANAADDTVERSTSDNNVSDKTSVTTVKSKTGGDKVSSATAGGTVGSVTKSGGHSATAGGGGSSHSGVKHSAIDVAAVAAAASAAAAAVAAQLKAVKSEAGLILSRGVSGGALTSSSSIADISSVGSATKNACVNDVKNDVKKEQGVPAAAAKKTEIPGAGMTAGDSQVAPTLESNQEVVKSAATAEGEEDKSGFVPLGSVKDEYDPTVPNDYISVYRERIRKQQREELERLRQQELEKQRRERELALGGPGMPSLSGVAFSDGVGGAGGVPGQPGAAPAGGAAAPAPPALPSYIDPAKKSFAARMMEKMGWKHGEGLGVNKQGITAPLVAKKTAMRSGVIVQGAEVVAAAAQARGVQFNRPPTRVLLLLNMVGRGEVDEDLKQETEEEAAKFGNLLQVRVVEAPDAPDEEAVRIFCEYERKEEAMLAFLTMNGRVFGGRTVRSKFFCEERWQKEDLMPNPEEEADKKTE